MGALARAAIAILCAAAVQMIALPRLIRSLALCPNSPWSHRHIRLLRVGDNRTSAAPFALPPTLWPWRSPLADELARRDGGGGAPVTLFDADGHPLRCAPAAHPIPLPSPRGRVPGG